MPLLSDGDCEILRERFQRLDAPVTVKLFGESDAMSILTIPGRTPNEMAKVTRELLEEVAALSDKLSLEAYDVNGDGKAEADRLGIERIPAIVLGDDDGGRVRFYGAPVGNEFPTILEGIDALSNGTPKVRQEVARALAEHVDQPVNLKVFVTPT